MSRRRPPPLCNRARRWREPAHRSFISESGEFVVTIDRFADEQSESALVIVGPGERIMSRFALSALLSPVEIAAQRDHTVAADWWYRRILFDYSIDGAEFRLTLDSGRTARIDLITGRLIPA